MVAIHSPVMQKIYILKLSTFLSYGRREQTVSNWSIRNLHFTDSIAVRRIRECNSLYQVPSLHPPTQEGCSTGLKWRTFARNTVRLVASWSNGGRNRVALEGNWVRFSNVWQSEYTKKCIFDLLYPLLRRTVFNTNHEKCFHSLQNVKIYISPETAAKTYNRFFFEQCVCCTTCVSDLFNHLLCSKTIFLQEEQQKERIAIHFRVVERQFLKRKSQLLKKGAYKWIHLWTY